MGIAIIILVWCLLMEVVARWWPETYPLYDWEREGDFDGWAWR